MTSGRSSRRARISRRGRFVIGNDVIVAVFRWMSISVTCFPLYVAFGPAMRTNRLNLTLDKFLTGDMAVLKVNGIKSVY